MNIVRVSLECKHIFCTAVILNSNISIAIFLLNSFFLLTIQLNCLNLKQKATDNLSSIDEIRYNYCIDKYTKITMNVTVPNDKNEDLVFTPLDY